MDVLASEVYVHEDEYVASVTFKWPDSHMAYDFLTIERDWGLTDERPPPIWVSRRMPLYSGRAGIVDVKLYGHRVAIQFAQALAVKLQLPEQMHIASSMSTYDLDELRRAAARIFEGCDYFSECLSA